MLRNGKETRNPIDTSWKVHLFRSALNQCVIGFDLLMGWRHSNPSLCAGPSADTFLHRLGQSGLPHTQGHKPPAWVMLQPQHSCETNICELRQSPGWALTPHRVSLWCSGQLCFPSGLPQHPCLQLSLLNMQKYCGFSRRTGAMGLPLPAARIKHPIPMVRAELPQPGGQQNPAAASQEAASQVTWNKGLSCYPASLYTIPLSLILAKICLLPPTASLAKPSRLSAPFRSYWPCTHLLFKYPLPSSHSHDLPASLLSPAYLRYTLSLGLWSFFEHDYVLELWLVCGSW